MTLPIVDNCPECNGFYRDDRSYKKPRVDQRPRGPIIREGDDHKRTPVHDRLGGRAMLRDPIWFQMSTHIVGIQKESLFMIILIGLGGVQWV